MTTWRPVLRVDGELDVEPPVSTPISRMTAKEASRIT